MDWFELSDFAERAGEHSRIEAYKYSTQQLTRIEGTGILAYFDEHDFVTYSKINFGAPGTTKGILVNYSKGSDGGSVEIRLGDATGDIIAEFRPASTGDWSNYLIAYVGIDDVDGIHDLTFVGKEGGGIMNMDWFEL